MAKKKKTSLKPVNRGFATTSAPSKKAELVEEEAEEDPVLSTDPTADVKATGVVTDATIVQSGTGAHAGEAQGGDWEKEEEEGIYQGYVERMQEKADKETSRILKGMEFDRRMNKGYLPLSIDRRIRDEILDLHRSTQETSNQDHIPPPPPPTGPAREKALTKLYVTQKILTESGFPESDVHEYLSRPVNGGGRASAGGMAVEEDSWESALGQMWLIAEPGKVKAPY